MTEQAPTTAITITPTTEEDLGRLRSAFTGDYETTALAAQSDDFLLAALLGWHLRAAQINPSRLDGYVFTEFANRRAIAAGADFTDAYSDIRSSVRSCGQPSNQLITTNGLAAESPIEMRERAVRTGHICEVAAPNESLREKADIHQLRSRFFAT